MATSFDAPDAANKYLAMSPEEQTQFMSILTEVERARLKFELSARERIAISSALRTPSSDTTSEEEGTGSFDYEEAMEEMWKEIDSFDVSIIDSNYFKMFDYRGFKPREVLRSLLIAKRRNGVGETEFIHDILIMCALAVIKGSINDHIIAKLPSAGQTEIKRLEETYGLKRGSGRGEPSGVVTISRVGATFPGKIMQLILTKKVITRKFIGPFKSHTLPAVMRHQAFAAVLPATLRETVKSFLLDIITAFSVDQSINISPKKKDRPDLVSLFGAQRNFAQITADSLYPTEVARLAIFKALKIEYDEIVDCANAIYGILPGYRYPSREDFSSAIRDLA